MLEKLKAIESVFSEDAGQRGLGNINLPGEFERALDEINRSQRIMVLTGFFIRAADIGETDGPLGALSIASSLEKLGKEVMLVTDEYSYKLLTRGSKELGLEAKIVEVPYEKSEEFCIDLLDEFKPDHFISIERPGKAFDGNFHSMRGENLSDKIPDTDILMVESKNRNIRTTAIGDGGNELGMGKIKEDIAKFVDHGSDIAAVVASDNLILAGVSNWGGHGIAAGLSILNGKTLIYDATMEEKLLDAIVEEGSVDGCSKENVSTVDGLSLEKNLGIVSKMMEILNS